MTDRSQTETFRHPTAATTPPAARLAFLDALRGTAVALVLVQHVGELVSPAVRDLTASGLQLGQMGVMVFFLCSGFIIPASLERSRPGGSRAAQLRAFWRGRVFRLFPLYWLSLGGALVLTRVGAHPSAEGMSGADWLVNLSMVQGLAGTPDALPLYWTLALEMVFYGALSALFLLGWHRHSVALSLSASALCLLLAVAAEPLLGRPAPLAVGCLATMVSGTVVARWHDGTVRLPVLLGCVAASLGSGVALLGSVTLGTTDASPGFVPVLTAWLGAHAVFGLGVALRRRPGPGWLRRLGTLSYSVYLVQGVVLLAVPALPSPLVTAALWVVVTLAVSEVTHRAVELPMIRLGRHLGRPRPAGPPVARPVRRPSGAVGTVRRVLA